MPSGSVIASEVTQATQLLGNFAGKLEPSRWFLCRHSPCAKNACEAPLEAIMSFLPARRSCNAYES